MIYPWLSILILKVQRTLMSFKSSFWAMEDAGGSWLELGILILILIRSLVFDIPMIQILAVSKFWRCKWHQCPLSPQLGLWRMLQVSDWGLAPWTWFWYGCWSLIYPLSKFWLSIWILKMQRTSCPLSPHLEPWRMLEVPESGLASWSWFGYGLWYTHDPNFGFLSWFWRCKEHHVL